MFADAREQGITTVQWTGMDKSLQVFGGEKQMQEKSLCLKEGSWGRVLCF